MMGVTKCIASVFLLLSAIGSIQAANECTSAELGAISDCIKKFPATAASIVNKTCTLNTAMCKEAENIETCLNRHSLWDKCRGYLDTHINKQLEQAQLNCTVSEIEKQCKVKIERKNKCKDDERKEIDSDLTSFSLTNVNRDCNLTEANCKGAVKTATSLNGAKLTNTCRSSLPGYIDYQFLLSKLKCTLSSIEKQCPKAKVNTSGASHQAMLSLLCLFVSLITGFRFTM